MSKKYIKVSIVNPMSSIFFCGVDFISLRGSAGDMGVAYGHTELLSTMPPGVINIKKGNKNEIIYISGGIIEVTPSKVSIMVDDMERAENIRQDEAEKAKIQAQQTLQDRYSSDIDIKIAKQMLLNAKARLHAVSSYKNVYYSQNYD